MANAHTRNQQQMRLLVQAINGHLLAREQGHDLGPFELEATWDSAVATCKRCGELAAIDLGERPYFFGPAYKKRCK